MQTKSLITMALLSGFLSTSPAWAQLAADEQEFQELVAALRADDAERQMAISTCVEQGLGSNLDALANVMEVPIERSVQAWCTRMTNGMTQGKVSFADINALGEGTITPSLLQVLKTESEDK